MILSFEGYSQSVVAITSNKNIFSLLSRFFGKILIFSKTYIENFESLFGQVELFVR